MATLSIRMNDETKADFEKFCKNVGLTVSAAVNMFAKATVREHKIPFEVTDEDPFWSEENQERLALSIQHAKEGKLVKHDLSEMK